MALQFRKLEHSAYSPKSSARGSRSSAVPRPDSTTGTLKATISLGKKPSVVHTGPFYLIKETPGKSELTGASNLMAHYGLEHSYNKACKRKVKDTLSSFLPHLPGFIDSPGYADNSSLRSVINKPPIGGKQLLPLNYAQLSGFRLHPGRLPDEYHVEDQSPQKKKNKHKKHKFQLEGTTSLMEPAPSAAELSAEKKHKKGRRHDVDKEMKKKKKKDKKEKRKGKIDRKHD